VIAPADAASIHRQREVLRAAGPNSGPYALFFKPQAQAKDHNNGHWLEAVLFVSHAERCSSVAHASGYDC